MSTATLTRPSSTYSPHMVRSLQRQSQQDGSNLTMSRTRRKGRSKNGEMVRKVPPPLIQKVGLAAQVYGIQGFMGTVMWLQGWREWLFPPGGGPNIVKAYEARPNMPVRIFFPATYDLTSPQTLPTVFTIHGGGFCIGTSKDDDEWNRTFADSQNMLVISLPYQKAPRAPFPMALQDLEALFLAVLADESLPIDRTSRSSNNTRTRGGASGRYRRAKGRVALLGFDAGGNLALGLSQLFGVRRCAVPPTAVVSVSGYLDLERAAADKMRNRAYKPTLSHPRNGGTDMLATTYPAYVWSYVPYGHDLRDPLLSPAFASWRASDDDDDSSNKRLSSLSVRSKRDSTVVVNGGLPPHVCLVGAELDMLAHESWRLACRLVRDGGIARGDGRTGRWRVPDPDAPGAEEAALQQRICGRTTPSEMKGRLEVLEEEIKTSSERPEDGMDGSKRFGFEVRWRGHASSAMNSITSGNDYEMGEEEGSGSVKWILVPDVLHGFDRGWWVGPAGGAGAAAAAPARSQEETVRDAKLKGIAYVSAVGEWLRGTVWDISS